MKNVLRMTAAAFALSGALIGTSAAQAAPIAATALIEAAPTTTEVRYHGPHGYRGPMRHHGRMVRGRGHHYGLGRGRHRG